jgi:hypothetical protein
VPEQPIDIDSVLKHQIQVVGEGIPANGDWVPVAWLFSKDGVQLYPTPWDEKGKDFVFTTYLPNLIREHRAFAYAQVATAWMAEVDLGKPLPEGPVSEVPGRREIVVLVVMDECGERCWFADIHRGGEHPKLGEWELMEADHISGRQVERVREALFDVRLGFARGNGA